MPERKELVKMKVLLKLVMGLMLLAAAAYGVMRFIDKIYEKLGTDYVEFPWDVEWMPEVTRRTGRQAGCLRGAGRTSCPCGSCGPSLFPVKTGQGGGKTDEEGQFDCRVYAG